MCPELNASARLSERRRNFRFVCRKRTEHLVLVVLAAQPIGWDGPLWVAGAAWAQELPFIGSVPVQYSPGLSWVGDSYLRLHRHGYQANSSWASAGINSRGIFIEVLLRRVSVKWIITGWKLISSIGIGKASL